MASKSRPGLFEELALIDPVLVVVATTLPLWFFLDHRQPHFFAALYVHRVAGRSAAGDGDRRSVLAGDPVEAGLSSVGCCDTSVLWPVGAPVAGARKIRLESGGRQYPATRAETPSANNLSKPVRRGAATGMDAGLLAARLL